MCCWITFSFTFKFSSNEFVVAWVGCCHPSFKWSENFFVQNVYFTSHFSFDIVENRRNWVLFFSKGIEVERKCSEATHTSCWSIHSKKWLQACTKWSSNCWISFELHFLINIKFQFKSKFILTLTSFKWSKFLETSSRKSEKTVKTQRTTVWRRVQKNLQ